jgi:tripeptidyl-peptidase-1
MRSLTLALTAAVALLNTTAALSIPRNVKYVTHEKREGPHASHALTKRSPISPDSLLPIRIGLTQRDLHLGYDYILDVSHPESKNYGKHYTAAEVNKLFAPTAETVQAVRDWLISSGIAEHRIKVSDNKGWLAFDAAVEEAEELFRASYYQQDHHSAPNKFNIGCDE